MTTTTIAPPVQLDARRRASPWRRAVARSLARLHGGAVELEEHGVRQVLGEAGGLAARITVRDADQHYQRARREVDFIKRHIFPGSCIPSISALVGAAAASDLQLRQLQDYGHDYARTLAAWRENLAANGAAVERLTEERFRRLWHFYLSYCEGGFAEGYIGVSQLVFERPGEV